MICAYPPCDETIENPKTGQRYCSPAHRVADWRLSHQTRCPKCETPIRAVIQTVDEPRTERQEEE